MPKLFTGTTKKCPKLHIFGPNTVTVNRRSEKFKDPENILVLKNNFSSKVKFLKVQKVKRYRMESVRIEAQKYANQKEKE